MGQPKTTRWCAVYTRKSTDENLNSEFTSMDAQREACEDFIKSRKEEGWQLYPERFDDAAFSGGNMDRPALQRLLALIRQGKVQVVVAYKYDRLSRNMKDFVKILDLFDKHGAAFVSVTQQFDTSTSIGRMFQTMLMGFAQFERELVSERTRDKRAAMVQKGMWPGGMPVIGYDVDSANRKLIVNRKEVKQTRDQFLSYLKEKSLNRAARKLNEQGYRLKRWVTKEGREIGGRRYNKTNLVGILKNPLYIGKLRYRDKVFDGQHPPIIEESLFNRTQKLLAKNGDQHKSANQDKHDFLLRGLVHCEACGSYMTPNFSYSKGRKYFYYKCTKVDKLDRNECPVRSVPAKELENIVLQRLSFLGQNKKLVEKIVKEAQTTSVRALNPLRQEKERVGDELRKIDQEARRIVATLGHSGNGAPKNRFILERLDELQATKQQTEERLAEIGVEIQRLENRVIDAEIIRQNLQRFSAVFAKLTPDEKKSLLQLLIKEVNYDRNQAKIKLTLRQLPDLDLQVEGNKVSFDESKVWLPGQGSNLGHGDYDLPSLPRG